VQSDKEVLGTLKWVGGYGLSSTRSPQSVISESQSSSLDTDILVATLRVVSRLDIALEEGATSGRSKCRLTCELLASFLLTLNITAQRRNHV
jgi:hypothetical protein